MAPAFDGRSTPPPRRTASALVDDMHRGIDGPRQRPMPTHGFLAVDRLMVRQGDVDADGGRNVAGIGDQAAHVLRAILVAAA